jgi:hypothetical protein
MTTQTPQTTQIIDGIEMVTLDQQDNLNPNPIYFAK